jgi:CheY-like chemotaxis protein
LVSFDETRVIDAGPFQSTPIRIRVPLFSSIFVLKVGYFPIRSLPFLGDNRANGVLLYRLAGAYYPSHRTMSLMNKIRVLIADDHALVRESVRAILAGEQDMEVVATAGNGEQAVELTAEHHPDVIVMDISMPKMDGIHATELIRREDATPRIVILSMHVNAALVQQAIRMGAAAYVLKRRATDELPQAIRAVIQGELFLSAAIPPTFLPKS